jgi:alcohol dehydrogenase
MFRWMPSAAQSPSPIPSAPCENAPNEDLPATIVNRITSHELTLAGSHGLAAHAYPALLALIAAGKLDPERLVDRTTTLDEAPAALASMDDFRGSGITIFTPNA